MDLIWEPPKRKEPLEYDKHHISVFYQLQSAFLWFDGTTVVCVASFDSVFKFTI